MFDQFAEKAKETILLSKRAAKDFGSDCIDTEHLLLGLLGMNEGMAVAVLRSFELSAKDVREQVEKFVPLGTSMAAVDIPFTEDAQKVFRLAMEEARNAGQTRIGTGHLLLGLCREGGGVASEVLSSLGLSVERVRKEILRLQQRYAEFVAHLQAEDPLLIAIIGEYGASEQRGSIEGSAGIDTDRLRQQAEKAPVIRLVDLIIRQAIKEHAKEIHIEPLEDRISLRFLIDGAFQEISPPARPLFTAIISRIKILAKLDLAAQHKLHEGAFVMKLEGREIRFKVVIQSTPNGEKATIILT